MGNAAFFAAYHHTKNSLTYRQKARDTASDKPAPPAAAAAVAASAAASAGVILLSGAMAGLAYTLAAHPLEIAAILMQSDVPVKRVAMVARGAHKGAGGAVGVGSGAMRTVLEYKCVLLARRCSTFHYSPHTILFLSLDSLSLSSVHYSPHTTPPLSL